MKPWIILAVGVLLSGVITTASAAPAGAALPLSGFSAITTDPASGRVFVSSMADGAVTASDAAGNVQAKLSGLPGADGLAVSGDTLYVALSGEDSIAAVDLVTFTVRARYFTGTGTCPAHLAATREVIWFGYGCGTSWSGRLGSLRMDQGTPVITLNLGGVHANHVPLVAADRGTTLLVGEQGSSSATIHVFDIVEHDLRIRVKSGFGTIGGFLNQLGMPQDGSQVLVATGSPYHVQGFTPDRLRLAAVYDVDGPYPAAAIAAPDGRRIAAGTTNSDPANANVFVHELGQSTPRVRANLGAKLSTRGLAWAPDSTRLYAVTMESGQVTLHTLMVQAGCQKSCR